MKKKIKILHTIRQGKIGGGEKHVMDLVLNLNSEHFMSSVLSFTDGPMVDFLRDNGIETFVIPTEKPFDINVWGKVKNLIQKGGYDIIHSHGTRACSNSFYGANRLKIKSIYTVHGWSFHPHQKGIIKWIREKSELFLTKKSTCTINVAQSNYDFGKNKLGVKNAVVVKNGVDLSIFKWDESYKDIRTELGIPTERILVSFIGRVTFQKNPTLFVAVAREVIEKDKNVHFLLVGEGELLEEVKSLVNQYQLSGNFTFSPFRNDIPDVLYATDIYCLSSRWEGLSIGMLEAMAMKCAVVASAVDGSKEVIDNGLNGILILSESEKEYADKILELASNEAELDTLKQNGFETVKAHFELSRMVKETEEIYFELLNNGK